MKTIVIGDIHGRAVWKQIVYTQKWDKVIFLGDYFDSLDIPPELQIINFQEIVKFKEENDDKVVLLIGNHDEHYFPFMGYSSTSGYNWKFAPFIGHLLSAYKDLLKMAHAENDVLFSHAGVGKTFLEENYYTLPKDYKFDSAGDIADKVNEIWKHKPLCFKFNGLNGTGDDTWQTPIWIRPKSLLIDTREIRKNFIQVVGHTRVTKIDIKGKATGGRYYFIDSLGTSKEYLIIEDGVFKVDKWEI